MSLHPFRGAYGEELQRLNEENARAALAATSLGADYVDASKATSGVTMERHRAQLRRVAEAAYSTGRAHGLLADEDPTVDLDAVIAECVK